MVDEPDSPGLSPVPQVFTTSPPQPDLSEAADIAAAGVAAAGAAAATATAQVLGAAEPAFADLHRRVTETERRSTIGEAVFDRVCPAVHDLRVTAETHEKEIKLQQ